MDRKQLFEAIKYYVFHYQDINIPLLKDENYELVKKQFTEDLQEYFIPNDQIETIVNNRIANSKRYLPLLDACFLPKNNLVEFGQSQVLYRGVDNLYLNFRKYTLLKTFTSTTTDLDIALKFISFKYKNKPDDVSDDQPWCCLLKLKLDKDVPFIDFCKYSDEYDSADEKEVLLPRNLYATIMKTEFEDHSYTIYRKTVTRKTKIVTLRISKHKPLLSWFTLRRKGSILSKKGVA